MVIMSVEHLVLEMYYKNIIGISKFIENLSDQILWISSKIKKSVVYKYSIEMYNIQFHSQD